MSEQLLLVAGLIILGYALLFLELFVLPGFGFFGIAGITSLVVASFLAVRFFGVATGGAVVGGVVMLTTVLLALLPRTPLGRWIVHRRSLKEAHSQESTLSVGEQGETETPLRPAGIARFGQDRESVVSDGEFVAAGERVQVVVVEGGRVVVEKCIKEERS